jgi:hypothetical protein
MEREFTFHVGTASIKGQVLMNGQPAVGLQNLGVSASQGAGSAQATMLDESRFELSALAGGAWTVSAGYSDGSTFRNTKSSVDLRENQAAEVNLEFNSPVHVLGLVQDGDGKPMAGATVGIAKGESGNPANTNSNTDGTFSILAKSGPNTVIARRATIGTSDPMPIDVPATGDTPKITLQLKPLGGSITATVLDESSGRPLGSAGLSLSSADYGFSTSGRADSNGVIKVDNVPAGKYKVTIAATGYASHEHQVEVVAGQTVQIDDVLPPGGMFTWILEDNRGYRLSDVPVRLTPLDGNSLQNPLEKKTSGGIVEFVAVPGAYNLAAQPKNFQPISITVQIVAGQPGDLTTQATPLAVK